MNENKKIFNENETGAKQNSETIQSGFTFYDGISPEAKGHRQTNAYILNLLYDQQPIRRSRLTEKRALSYRNKLERHIKYLKMELIVCNTRLAELAEVCKNETGDKQTS